MVKKQEDSKWQILADFMKKHWWKVILIILAGGIAVTGFKCEWGKVKVEKDPVNMPWKNKTVQGIK